MAIKYKIDVLKALKEKGYTQPYMQKNKIISSSTIYKLKWGEGIGWDNLDRICSLLHCQPADLIYYVDDTINQ